MVYDTKKYLDEIEKVIRQGPFDDSWESLSQFKTPEWFKNSKFGIFIHWGIFSVPECGNDWYARNMYLKDSHVYKEHREIYGPPNEFGYKDFIPMFRAEAFSPSDWLDLFQESGARYIVPVGEHHDGFQMYDSSLSDYCATKMGPKRDVLGELKEEAERRGITFCTSSHRAEHFWFMEGVRKEDPDSEELAFGGMYWPSVKGPDDFRDIYQAEPDSSFLEDWLIRTCEMVDKYRPQMLYFDWWIMNVGFKPYLKKFLAYYYNRGVEWGREVCVNYKFDACADQTAIVDIERGQMNETFPRPWQSDTAVARNSWSYTKDNQYKEPEEILQILIDIVSKNGSLLLNIGPKGDGSIPGEDARILREIGSWLKINGEGIYDTVPWKIYGEGPAALPQGHLTDAKKPEFSSRDIRFTYNRGALYAFVLKWPEDGVVKLTCFAPKDERVLARIESIEILGFDEIPRYVLCEEGLTIKTDNVKSSLPVCMKIMLS